MSKLNSVAKSASMSMLDFARQAIAKFFGQLYRTGTKLGVVRPTFTPARTVFLGYRLGVEGASTSKGFRIDYVVPRSAADRNGLKYGDYIDSVDGWLVGLVDVNGWDYHYPLRSELRRSSGIVDLAIFRGRRIIDIYGVALDSIPPGKGGTPVTE